MDELLEFAQFASDFILDPLGRNRTLCFRPAMLAYSDKGRGGLGQPPGIGIFKVFTWRFGW